MHVSFRLTHRCETLLGLAPAAVPRLDWPENPRTGLGPEFFRNLLELEVGRLLGPVGALRRQADQPGAVRER